MSINPPCRGRKKRKGNPNDSTGSYGIDHIGDQDKIPSSIDQHEKSAPSCGINIQKIYTLEHILQIDTIREHTMGFLNTHVLIKFRLLSKSSLKDTMLFISSVLKKKDNKSILPTTIWNPKSQGYMPSGLDELDTPYPLVLHQQLEIEKAPLQFDHVYGNVRWPHETKFNKDKLKICAGIGMGCGFSRMIMSPGNEYNVKVIYRGTGRHWNNQFGITRPPPKYVDSSTIILDYDSVPNDFPGFEDTSNCVFPSGWMNSSITNAVMWEINDGQVVVTKRLGEYSNVSKDLNIGEYIGREYIGRGRYASQQSVKLNLNLSDEANGVLTLKYIANGVQQEKILCGGLMGEFSWIAMLGGSDWKEYDCTIEMRKYPNWC